MRSWEKRTRLYEKRNVQSCFCGMLRMPSTGLAPKKTWRYLRHSLAEIAAQSQFSESSYKHHFIASFMDRHLSRRLCSDSIRSGILYELIPPSRNSATKSRVRSPAPAGVRSWIAQIGRAVVANAQIASVLTEDNKSNNF